MNTIDRNTNKKPIFALTMGDPAGIGPEITLKTLDSLQTSEYGVVVIGDKSVLEQACRFVKVRSVLRVIKKPGEFTKGSINILDMHQIGTGDFIIGKVQSQCGRAAYSYIMKSIDLAMGFEIAGVITNPISKEALKTAGIDFPGHTEIFASRTGVSDYSMMFLLDNVAVAHVTTHCSLRKAIDSVTRARVLSTSRLLYKTVKRLGVEKPRIAVGGLNPHAGEHGLFGDEEIKDIEPAVRDARNEGLNVTGPYPPDTVFMRAFKGEFDGVVSMVHDHGFVALKSRDFEHGVNITIGLPIIRTSVGHGTAFDIAGTGKASEESLRTAIEAAWRLWKKRME